MQNDKPVDITKLKYALYARKSTEDEGRQVRSIPDQVADCEKLANDLEIKVAKPYIKETKSAKLPGERPLFTQLIKDVRSKKYDGILCWHPDRLARNMIEAGQIIDMLDNGTLKDLRFVSHQFSNDANGKMLLGMLFVFSKHYSDDLSAKVNRGVKGNFSEGKSGGTPKHGYIRDENGIYQPVKGMHSLISTAWDMRSSEHSNRDILAFLNESNFHRMTKEKRIIRMTESTLSKMFQDPFYYGVLVQAGQTVDLREVYNFVPATDEATYNKVQEVSYRTSRGMYKARKRATFFPLRQFITCSYCSHKMYTGKSQPQNRKYLPKMYYRCDNPDCPRKELGIKRNVRAKNVFDWVQTFLEGDFKKIGQEYDRYSKLIDSQGDKQRITIKTQIQSKRGAINQVKAELDKRSMALSNLDKGTTAYNTVTGKISELEDEHQELEAAIAKLSSKLTDPTKLKLSKDEFLNLVKTAADKMKAGSAEQKDRIVRIIFLNLIIDGETVVNYICREPFASMLELSKISYGRGDRT